LGFHKRVQERSYSYNVGGTGCSAMVMG